MKETNNFLLSPSSCTCYILNNKVYFTKFDAKAHKCIFLGYSKRSKAYKVYNCETKMIEESISLRFDDEKPESKNSELVESCAKIQVSKDAPESTLCIYALTGIQWF